MPDQVFKGRIAEYVPDFKTTISHFAIHPGGKAVIDTVEKALGLRPDHSQPNRAAYERYGNTSSSSTWCSTLENLHLSRYVMLTLIRN